MTQESIFHLEKVQPFIDRLRNLNQVHAADGDGLQDEGAKALAAIHRHFPTDVPIHDQAAYLIRAFSGLRPFAEANHRTGWDYLAELIHHNDHELLADDAEGRNLGNEVWDRIREAYGDDGIDVDAVAETDGIHAFLADWFHPRIG